MAENLESQCATKSTHIFAWKLGMDALPMKKNKAIRKIERTNQCSLCGISSEDSFHANVECPQAKHLRDAMREHWPLPAEAWFRRTGVDWLLLLLDKCSQEQGDLCLLVF
jgi:hypothetical protein